MAGSSPSKRRDTDMMKLMMSDFDVLVTDENNAYDFVVKFQGPQNTPYEGGTWRVNVLLPKEYPFKSPSIGFINKIFHPNVDESSGTVCLDVINQTWSPMYDLVNVFNVFLPQLLCYPNPSDPLNAEAASLLMRNPESYNQKVRDYVRRYASINFDLSNKPQELVTRTASNSSPGVSILNSPEISKINLDNTFDPEENNDDGYGSELSEMSDI